MRRHNIPIPFQSQPSKEITEDFFDRVVVKDLYEEVRDRFISSTGIHILYDETKNTSAVLIGSRELSIYYPYSNEYKGKIDVVHLKELISNKYPSAFGSLKVSITPDSSNIRVKFTMNTNHSIVQWLELEDEWEDFIVEKIITPTFNRYFFQRGSKYFVLMLFSRNTNFISHVEATILKLTHGETTVYRCSYLYDYHEVDINTYPGYSPLRRLKHTNYTQRPTLITYTG